MATGAGEGGLEQLPKLRDELIFMADGEAHLGAGGTILDPVRQAYFRIGPEAHQLLSLWSRCRTADALMAEACSRFGLVVERAQLDGLLRFLERNALLADGEAMTWRRLAEAERRKRPGLLAWAVHNYLFVKVPLIRPDRLLRHLVPLTAPLYTPAAALTIAVIGAAGLYLASRQWDVFLGTFPHLFSVEGALLYVVALGIVKSLHEFGHAVTAARYGCRVPTMGVCFMVLFPMLYTDVTDAWKLPSRRDRLAIDAAGLVVETALACIATLLWSFLPDGILRSLAFAVATTGWLLSLGLNLNPFMRFDGYYILSDLTGIENLQERAFALGTWRLREVLFGLGEPAPEPLARTTRRWLVLYAWGVWIYRLVLFTGIALAVYHIAFKLLGVALFVVEIAIFVARPVWHEILQWWQRRLAIVRRPRFLLTLTVSASLLLVALVPWSTRIAAPAVVESEQLAQLYPVRAGRVERVAARIGDDLAAGAEIVRLASPDLDHEIRLTELRRRIVLLRIARRSADAVDRSDSHVLADMLASLDRKRTGLETERRELTIVAPFAGRVVELDPHLAPGRWLQRRDLVALVRGHGRSIVRGYIREDDIVRVDAARPARFVPEDLVSSALQVRALAIAVAGSPALDIRELASHYGGPIAVRNRAAGQDARQLVPVTGQFLVEGLVDSPTEADRPRIVRGTILAEGRPESFALRIWRQVVQVLIRESGS